MPRDEFVELCRELLEPAGPVHVRRMFGGHGFTVDGLFVAIVARDRLFLKADATTQARFADAGCERFTVRARDRAVSLNYWTVPAEAMESPALMQPWLRLALQAALSARQPRRNRPSPAGRRTGTSSSR